METLGDRIKQLRNELTQEELAAILGVDRSTLASWEVNRREPDIATLCRIATFFKVSVDWLIGHKPGKECLPSRAGLLHETANDYRATATDSAWHKVIAAAKQYGFEPDAVYQLLELTAKISLSLKKVTKNKNNLHD
ncbi:hypothetical protein SCACP_34010 [Sporomusa carbonis]|uniref:helix-turn-helix domain-containing protein n=1 Tax=Sporomusa carbonis TaxID=3076075 RepID=UPI003A6145C0